MADGVSGSMRIHVVESVQSVPSFLTSRLVVPSRPPRGPTTLHEAPQPAVPRQRYVRSVAPYRSMDLFSVHLGHSEPAV